MRKHLRKIHKWFGIVFAILIVAQAVSGSLLAFRAPLERALAGAAREVSGPHGTVSLDAALSAIQGARPDAHVSRLYFPQQETDTITARLLVDSGRAYEFVAVDQGADYQVQSLDRSSGVMFMLFRWHEYLLVKGPGNIVNILLGVGVIFLALTGVYFWWPLRKRQGLKISWKARPKIKWYDIHRVLGVVAAPFLILSAVTGASITLRAFDWPTTMDPALVTENITDVPLDPALTLLASGVGQHSGPIKEVRFSLSRNEASFLVYSLEAPWPAAVDRIGVSTETGRVISSSRAADANSWDRVLGWLYPLHSGKAFGMLGQAFVLALGLVLVLTAGGGIWLWLLRAGYVGQKTGKK